MKICPACKSYMKFNMKYNCGQPYAYYTCMCGYDQSKNTTSMSTVTTNSEIKKEMQRCK